MIAKVAAGIMILVAGLFNQATTQQRADPVYIALGDSVAAGIGSSLPRERSFPALLGEHFSRDLEIPVQVVNLAVPGESAASFLTAGQLDEFRAVVDELSASGTTIQAVTLTLGGNDILSVRDDSVAQRQQALDSFAVSMPEAATAVRDAVGPDVPMYLSTVYDPTGEDADARYTDAWWIARFNEVIRDAALAANATLVDLAASLGPDARDLTRYPVDVHPTNDGHARIAAEFWRATGLDADAPQIEVLSTMHFTRFTPTLRFLVAPDVDLDSLAVDVGDAGAVAYPPVQVDDGVFAMLIDASGTQAEDLVVTLSVSDFAGNSTTLDVTLMFDVSP